MAMKKRALGPLGGRGNLMDRVVLGLHARTMIENCWVPCPSMSAGVKQRLVKKGVLYNLGIFWRCGGILL